LGLVSVLIDTNDRLGLYTGWAKKVSLIIFAITLPTASQFLSFFAHTVYTIGNWQPEDV